MKTLLLTLILSTNVALARGNEGPGGGGGFKIEGNYLTFGSAKVKIKKEVPLREIGGMSLLLDVVNNKMALPVGVRYQLREAIFPSDSRQYFLLEDLSTDKQLEIKRKFIEAIGTDQVKGEVVVYAITLGKKTFLLPNFNEIKKESGKAAILFHEALWVLDSQLKYSFVIDSEIKMQNFIEKMLEEKKASVVYDSDLYENLELLFLDSNLSLIGAAEQDRKNGFEDLSLIDIIGTEAFDIYQKQEMSIFKALSKSTYYPNFTFISLWENDERAKMDMSIKYHLYEAENKAPDRELVKALNKKVSGLVFTLCPTDIFGTIFNGPPLFIHPQRLQEVYSNLKTAKIGFKTLRDLQNYPAYGPGFSNHIKTHKNAKSIVSETELTSPLVTVPGSKIIEEMGEETCRVNLMFEKISGSQYRVEKTE